MSDVHANELALTRVVADARASGVEQVICLGDVATLGPRPRETLDILRALAVPCILGNHDEFLLDSDLVRSYTQAPAIVAAIDWCRSELRTEDFELLRSFRRTHILELDTGKLSLFHGSPRSHMEDLLATTPEAELRQALDGHEAEIMAGGHTHLPMVRRVGASLLVNPGSVGLPFEAFAFHGPPRILPCAEYAVVTIERSRSSVDLRRVLLEKSALRSQALSRPWPLASMLDAEYA
ncbi:MAG: metallophosphoesterase family protein [Deltaproteobacteria bacterium]|nr:metallophosphoesterase family protein [Deltaproteobacteria bacterium]